MSGIGLHWLRRDLRLHDNAALASAAAEGRRVVCCFVLDPRILERDDTAPRRVHFLLVALAELDATLREHGSALVVRRGDAVLEIPRLAHEVGASVVTAVRDAEPFARDRDRRVDAALRDGVRLALTDEQTVTVLRDTVRPDGTPYTVYGAYRRRFDALLRQEGIVPAARAPLQRLVARADLPAHEAVPTPAAFGVGEATSAIEPGERAARRALERFVDAAEGLGTYDRLRNRPDRDATSRLSAHLRFGTIGIRAVLRAVTGHRERTPNAAVRSAVDSYVGELAWRDFYGAVLWHFPQVEHEAFRPEMQSLEWEPDRGGARLRAWTEGRTGYPIVDAAMRQLAATGWMHNRCRLVVASFLTKDLHLSWQAGERHFMRTLVDGDLANNNGGWQWTASTGTDPQPYFRIFNPVLQGEKFDPDGAYVRQWVPELASLPADRIHRPWELDAPPGDYPARIVLHERERDVALARYAAASKRR